MKPEDDQTTHALLGQIATALADEATSQASLSRLIGAAAKAVPEAEEHAACQRRKSLDPRLPIAEVEAARKEADEADFDAQRTKAAHELLQDKLAKAKERDADIERITQYKRAEAQRDHVAERINAEYPGLADRLASLATRS